MFKKTQVETCQNEKKERRKEESGKNRTAGIWVIFTEVKLIFNTCFGTMAFEYIACSYNIKNRFKTIISEKCNH